MNIKGKTATEIFDCVRQLAKSKTLKSGELLPSVRELAVTLGVNRNTVAAAYKRLVTAGIAVSQGRRGTMIRPPKKTGEQEGVVPGSPLFDVASGNPNPLWLPDIDSTLAKRPYKHRLYGEPTVCPDLEEYARQ